LSAKGREATRRKGASGVGVASRHFFGFGGVSRGLADDAFPWSRRFAWLRIPSRTILLPLVDV
jgi:hypothetical protein